MRNLIKFVVLPTIMLLVLACNRPIEDVDLSQEHVSETTSMTMFARGSEWTEDQLGDSLSNDEDFLALAEKLDYFSQTPKDLEEINRIMALEETSEEDQYNLMQAMGYASIEEAYNFDIQNYNSISRLSQTYNLSDLPSEFLNQAIEIAFENIIAQTNGVCDQRLNNCTVKAKATYVITAVGCVAAGGTIAGASFWCGGCATGFGIAVGTVCVTAAAAHMGASLSDCNLDYRECIDKK